MEWFSFRALSDEGKNSKLPNFTHDTQVHPHAPNRYSIFSYCRLVVQTWHEVSSGEGFTGHRGFDVVPRKEYMSNDWGSGYLAGMDSMIPISGQHLLFDEFPNDKASV